MRIFSNRNSVNTTEIKLNVIRVIETGLKIIP